MGDTIGPTLEVLWVEVFSLERQQGAVLKQELSSPALALDLHSLDEIPES